MFTFKDNAVTVDPKLLFIPEFRRIWDRDKTKAKKRANLELAFVYYTADYKSEYNAYGLEKEELIAKDIMGDIKYLADELMLEAIEKYEKMQESYSLRYLKSTRKTVDSLILYYEQLQYDPKGENKDFAPDKITKALKETEVIVEKLEKWDKKVLAEEEGMQIRGGGRVGMFEDPEKATWINKRTKPA